MGIVHMLRNVFLEGFLCVGRGEGGRMRVKEISRRNSWKFTLIKGGRGLSMIYKQSPIII